MTPPIAQFGYIKNGLEVQFNSLCLNVTPDSTYSWNFGGGTSTQENPLFEFPTAAIYTVSLTVTNPDNQTDETEITINLSNSPEPGLFNNIENMVDLYAPSSIIDLVKNHNQKQFLIAKWQLYLQPLVNDPSIEEINTHVPENWPPLVNILIAKLVVIDIIEMELSAFLINSAHAGAESVITQSSSSSSSSSTDSLPKGGIKSIETGPTKVERFENKDVSSASEKTKNLANALLALSGKGGILDKLKESVCAEANRLSIYLPFCPMVNKVRIFSVIKSHC